MVILINIDLNIITYLLTEDTPTIMNTIMLSTLITRTMLSKYPLPLTPLKRIKKKHIRSYVDA